MTTTEIIEMAIAAQLIDHRDTETSLPSDFLEPLKEFAALVRNAALEEAAVVCEAIGQEANIAWRSAYRTLDQGIERGADDCADTIRQLKETK